MKCILAAALTLVVAQQATAGVCMRSVSTAWGLCPASAGAQVCVKAPPGGGCGQPQRCFGAGPLCFNFSLGPGTGPATQCPLGVANLTSLSCVTDALRSPPLAAVVTRTSTATVTPIVTPTSTPTASATPTVTGAASLTPTATPTFVTANLTCKLKIEQTDATHFQARCFICNSGPDMSDGFNVRYEISVPQQIKHESGVPKNVGMAAHNSTSVAGTIDSATFVSCAIVDVHEGGTQWPEGTSPGSCSAELPCDPVTIGPTVTWICGSPIPAYPDQPMCP